MRGQEGTMGGSGGDGATSEGFPVLAQQQLATAANKSVNLEGNGMRWAVPSPALSRTWSIVASIVSSSRQAARTHVATRRSSDRLLNSWLIEGAPTASRSAAQSASTQAWALVLVAPMVVSLVAPLVALAACGGEVAAAATAAAAADDAAAPERGAVASMG